MLLNQRKEIDFSTPDRAQGVPATIPEEMAEDQMNMFNTFAMASPEQSIEVDKG